MPSGRLQEEDSARQGIAGALLGGLNPELRTVRAAMESAGVRGDTVVQWGQI